MTAMDRGELTWLKCEHRDIAREIAALRSWWESRDPTTALNSGEMGRRVMELHDRLGAHFTAEENGRYLQRAQEVRPELASEVLSLHDDHRRLRLSLSELSARLARGDFRSADPDKLWRQLEEVLSEVCDHEAAEEAVLVAAFGGSYQDAGG
jgi:hypothetical protein